MLKTIGAYAVSRILSGGLLYLTLVALIYALDKSSYEQFSAGFAVYQLVSILVFGWIYAIIPHLIAGLGPEEQLRAQAELVSAFAWMCLAALATFAAASAFGALDLSPLVLASVAVAVVAGSASEQAMTFASARQQPRLYLATAVTRYGAGLLLALAAALLAMGAPGAFLGLAAGAVAALVVADRSLRLRAAGLKWIGPRRLGRLLGTGLPAVVAFAGYPLVISLNRLVIAESCSLEAAAALGVVSDLVSGPVLLVFAAINLALMPLLFGAANRGDAAAFKAMMWRVIGLQMAVIVPGVLFFLLFGEMIGRLLLSSLPPVTAEMLPWVAIAALLFIPINTAAGVALACRKIAWATFYSLVMLAGSVILVLRENCDLLAIAKILTFLMALSSVVALLFLYRFRNLPTRADPVPSPDRAEGPLPPAGL